MKQGILIHNNVHLKNHEYSTVKLFLDRGIDVELIPPSKIKGLKMPDIMMMGVEWEIKSPTGNGKNTLKNTVQSASHQSSSIILDLRRTPLHDKKSLCELERLFKLSRRLKRMKLVIENGTVLDYNK